MIVLTNTEHDTQQDAWSIFGTAVPKCSGTTLAEKMKYKIAAEHEVTC